MREADLEMLQYAGCRIPNLPFNRAAILAVEAVITAVTRSRRLTNRTTRQVADWVISNIGHFTIMQTDPNGMFLAFWEEAAQTSTGPEAEYMVSVIMEIYSVWRSLAEDEAVRKMCVQLYPKVPAASTVLSRLEEKGEVSPEIEAQVEAYNSSQAFKDLPSEANLQKAVDGMPWVTPWLVLGTANHQLIEYLITILDNLGKGTEPEKPEGGA